MNNYSVQAKSLTKIFGRRIIFDNLNFILSEKKIFGITGANGSGKSTLVKIIAGIIEPSKGKVIHKINEKEISSENLHDFIGFAAPYLVLYDEFSAWENLIYTAKIRGIKFQKEKSELYLNQFKLFEKKDDLLKTYSSGMKQRLKFIFSLIHLPKLIILDEPTSNIDDEGKELVYKIIEEESKENIIIIASNEKSDIQLCSETLKLGK